MNKSLIYLIYFTIYTFVILWFGKYGFRKIKTARDFYVAGNSLGLAASIFTFSATWFSAASMQGLTGALYCYGYSAALYVVITWFLGASILNLLPGRLKDYDVVSVPEFFRVRYDSRLLQAMGGLVIIISYIFYIIIQIRGFGIVMTQLLDIPYTLSIFMVYLFILYTTFGGLFSVARTDAVNYILIILGTFVAAFLILRNMEGITEIHRQVLEINTYPFKGFHAVTNNGSMLDPFANGLLTPVQIITVFFGWGLGLASNPQYATRVLAARNKRVATRMIGISVLILAVVYTFMFPIGIGARVLIPTISGIECIDEIFPYVIDNVVYSPISGFVLISVVAVAVSTANSQLLLIASGFSYDIYKNYINPNISEDRLLNLNRVVIYIAGTISLVLSIDPPQNLLSFGGYVISLFSSSFLFPLYGGLLWQKATKEGAIASFCGGLLGLGIFYVLMLEHMKENIGYMQEFVIHPAVFGVIISFILFYIVSKYTYDKAHGGSKIEA